MNPLRHYTSAALAAVALIVFLSCGGCDDDPASGDASSSSSPSAGAIRGAAGLLSAEEREAQQVVLAELDKHWVETADGWTSAIAGQRALGIPERYLAQLRELAVDDVEPFELSDADRLNGIEWGGEVTFKMSPVRQAGERGSFMTETTVIEREPGRWSRWADIRPEGVRVLKSAGKWQIRPGAWVLSGAPPTPDDYAAAGVPQ